MSEFIITTSNPRINPDQFDHNNNSTSHSADSSSDNTPTNIHNVNKMSPPTQSNLSLQNNSINSSLSLATTVGTGNSSSANIITLQLSDSVSVNDNTGDSTQNDGQNDQDGQNQTGQNHQSDQNGDIIASVPVDGQNSNSNANNTAPTTQQSQKSEIDDKKNDPKPEQLPLDEQKAVLTTSNPSSTTPSTPQKVNRPSQQQQFQHRTKHYGSGDPRSPGIQQNSFLTNHHLNGSTTYITATTNTNTQSVLRSTTTKTSKQGTIGKNHPEHELVYDMMVGMRTRFAALEQQEFQSAAKTAKALRDKTQPLTHEQYTLNDEHLPVDGVQTSTITSTPSVVGSTNTASGAQDRPRDALKLNILPPPPPYTPQPLASMEFRTNVKQNFPKKGSIYTPPVQLDEFKFKDYCPKVFRAIRQFFGIHPIEYINSVCGNAEYIEFISNSKSGEFFCYTHDFRYMIKTISKGESLLLRAILPAYYNHIMDNPHTLLTRFFGMYRVNSRHLTKTHFLLMGSVFFTQFQEDVSMTRVYDMKGSVIGRSLTEKEKQRENPVYKDNDFLQHNRKIVLKPHISAKLREQIAADVEFLRKMQVMDYSLLLGILDLEKQEQYAVPLLDSNGNILPVIYLDAQTGQPIMDRHMESIHENIDFDEDPNMTDITHRFQVTGFTQSPQQNGPNNGPNGQNGVNNRATTPTSVNGNRMGQNDGQNGQNNVQNGPNGSNNVQNAVAGVPITMDVTDGHSSSDFTPVLQDGVVAGANLIAAATNTNENSTTLQQNNSEMNMNRQSSQQQNQGNQQYNPNVQMESNQIPLQHSSSIPHPTMTKTFSSTSNSNGLYAPTPSGVGNSSNSGLNNNLNQTQTPRTVIVQRKKQPHAHLPKNYHTSGKLHDVNPSFEPFHNIPDASDQCQVAGAGLQPFNEESTDGLVNNISNALELVNPLQHPQHASNDGQNGVNNAGLPTSLSRSPSSHNNHRQSSHNFDTSAFQQENNINNPVSVPVNGTIGHLHHQQSVAIIALAPVDVVVAPTTADDSELQPNDQRARARTIVQKEKKSKKDKKDTKEGKDGEVELQTAPIATNTMKRRQTISNYDYPNTWQMQSARNQYLTTNQNDDDKRGQFLNNNNNNNNINNNNSNNYNNSLHDQDQSSPRVITVSTNPSMNSNSNAVNGTPPNPVPSPANGQNGQNGQNMHNSSQNMQNMQNMQNSHPKVTPMVGGLPPLIQSDSEQGIAEGDSNGVTVAREGNDDGLTQIQEVNQVQKNANSPQNGQNGQNGQNNGQNQQNPPKVVTSTTGITPIQPLNVIIPAPTANQAADSPMNPSSPSYIAVPQQMQENVVVLEDDDIITTSIFTQDMGGIRGSQDDRNKIFYLGIIDILTFYNWRKKGEVWLKGLRYEKDQISAVNPDDYASRFIKFMDSYVVGADDDEDKGFIVPLDHVSVDETKDHVDDKKDTTAMTPAERKKYEKEQAKKEEGEEKKRQNAKKEEEKMKKEEEKRLAKEKALKEKEDAKRAKEAEKAEKAAKEAKAKAEKDAKNKEKE